MPTSALNRKFAEADQHYADMQELYTMLQVSPLKEAVEILRRFRSEDESLFSTSLSTETW